VSITTNLVSSNPTHGGRDRMIVGFTTTYANSAYHHWRCEFEPHSWISIFKFTVIIEHLISFITLFWVRATWCLTPLSTIFQLYRGVLWVEETGENHRSDHWQTLSHTDNVISSKALLSIQSDISVPNNHNPVCANSIIHFTVKFQNFIILHQICPQLIEQMFLVMLKSIHVFGHCNIFCMRKESLNNFSNIRKTSSHFKSLMLYTTYID
jgi:hypothetical protein